MNKEEEGSASVVKALMEKGAEFRPPGEMSLKVSAQTTIWDVHRAAGQDQLVLEKRGDYAFY